MEKLSYLSGFGNSFETEAVAGALPKGQNSPQQVPHGLYAEQLSGSAFTAHRGTNLRTWLYRIQPSVVQCVFEPYQNITAWESAPAAGPVTPSQLRWQPLPFPTTPTDFIHGLVTFAVQGDVSSMLGAAIHLYACNASMEDSFFYNADGELLIVPQQGALLLRTECGELIIAPREIGVIPRGMKFQIKLIDKTARGYVLENYGLPLQLPERGLIGANGLANTRDFLIPTAAYETREGNFVLTAKFQGHLWQAQIDHSPLDVVAWHGNYTPYKYDLTLFNTINTVSFDHPDPSIFTVLTSPSAHPGIANVDFVIFPERWLVAEHTFRPPYFHRNIMSEYMGLIYGIYDAKEGGGFVPGGGSLHNSFSGHGPDAKTFKQASTMKLAPHHVKDTLAFMFESRYVWRPTAFALSTHLLDPDYLACWKGLTAQFTPT